MVDLLEKSIYPIFVLDGPDGAGKTSLGLEMKEYLGGRYIHLTYRWKEKMNLYHYAAIRCAALLAQEQPVILDRWWPSEIVYAEVFRGGSRFMKHYFLLEHLATKLGVTYVMCLPRDREKYLEHYQKLKESRLEMYDSGLDKVYDSYDSFNREYFVNKENVARYDIFENFNDNDVSRKIVLRNICQKILEFSEDHRSTL